MGKYVLLLVMAAAGVWTLAQQQTTLQTAETEVEREEEMLARQAARTGLNSLLAKTRTVAKCPNQIVKDVGSISGTYETGGYNHGTYEAWLEEAPGVDLGYRAHAKGWFPGENGATVTLDRLIQRTENREGLVYGYGKEGNGNGKLKRTTTEGSEEFGSVPQGSAPRVRGMGPLATDLDDDGKDEVPYVRKSNRKIEIIDEEGDTQVLVNPDDVSQGVPADSATRLSSGTWGDQKSVFYANKGYKAIYRVSWGGGSATDPEEVKSPDVGAQAVLGIDDIDGDGEEELVFAGDSQQIRYIDGHEGSVEKLENGGVGTNKARIGTGSLVDLDGEGTASAIFVNGSNNLRVVDANEPDPTDRTIYLGGGSDDGAAEAPPTAIDLDDDDDLEIAYIRNENDDPDVEYIDPDGSDIRPLCGISVDKRAGLVSTR